MGEIYRKNNRKRVFNCKFYTFLIICLTFLFFSFIFIKNIIITNKCKDSLYAIDYYLTNYKDRDLRLIRVESISVIKQQKNSFTLEAIGMKSVEPFNKITVLATFNRAENNSWVLSSLEEVQH